MHFDLPQGVEGDNKEDDTIDVLKKKVHIGLEEPIDIVDDEVEIEEIEEKNSYPF